MIENVPPRVFVVHEPLKKTVDARGNVSWERTRDLSAASEFGELTYVFPAGHLPQDPAAILRTAREKLASFRSSDFLLLSGDTVGIAVAATIAAQNLEEDTRFIQYLVWHGGKRIYYKMRVQVWTEEPDRASEEVDGAAIESFSRS